MTTTSIEKRTKRPGTKTRRKCTQQRPCVYTGAPYLYSYWQAANSNQRSYLGTPIVSSSMRNGPQLSIGLASRNMVKIDSSSGKPLHVPVHGSTNTRQFPGPGQYACKEGFGKQHLSTHANPPEQTIGTAKRFLKSKNSDESKQPGPGQHDVPRVRLCKLSTKAADTPEIGFARSDRRRAVYIQGAENGHLKGRTCTEVGYRVYSSIDARPSSTFGGSASVGFAKSRRRDAAAPCHNCMDTPGPGCYEHGDAWGKGVKFPQTRRPITCPTPKTTDLPAWVTVGPKYDTSRKNSCIGEQVISARKNPCNFSFTRATRFSRRCFDVTPAPGTYRV